MTLLTLAALAVTPAWAGSKKADHEQAQAVAWEARCTEQVASITDLIARQDAMGRCLQQGVAAIGGSAATSNVDKIARRNARDVEVPRDTHTLEHSLTDKHGRTFRTVTTCRFYQTKTLCETY